MKSLVLVALTVLVGSNAFAVSESCEKKVTSIVSMMSAEDDKASDFTIGELTRYELTVYSAKKEYVVIVGEEGGKCEIIKACEAKDEGVCYDQK